MQLDPTSWGTCVHPLAWAYNHWLDVSATRARCECFPHKGLSCLFLRRRNSSAQWQLLKVLCWNVWEMIMHRLGLWVSHRRTLATPLTGPFPLPLVCSLTYLLDSSQTQLMLEIADYTWWHLWQPVVHLLLPFPSEMASGITIQQWIFLRQNGSKNMGSTMKKREPLQGKVSYESSWDKKGSLFLFICLFVLWNCFPFLHFC